MQIGFLRDQRDQEPIILSAPKYLVAANYAIAKERVGLVEHFVDYLISLWWIFGGFAYLASFLGNLSTITSSVLFLMGFVTINFLVSLPFEYYYKFKIDKDFKFNQMTPKMFFVDKLKSSVLFILIGGAIFALLSYIISSSSHWWIWGFVALFVVAILANVMMPFFMGLFNKFSPLEDIKLKSDIESMMQKVGLVSDGIFVMDASKRDSRLNAYFGGLGSTKRVVLFDTLIEKLTHNELLAVLGHELGHFKNGDILKNIGIMGFIMFIFFAIFGNLPQELFLQLHLSNEPYAIILVFLMFSPIMSFFLMPLISAMSRYNEYKADEFGGNLSSKDDLINALLKLANENKSFPLSHPLYIFFFYSHPPLVERLKELGYKGAGIMQIESEDSSLKEPIDIKEDNEKNI